MWRIRIELQDEAWRRLQGLALAERRIMVDQAAVTLEQALEVWARQSNIEKALPDGQRGAPGSRQAVPA